MSQVATVLFNAEFESGESEIPVFTDSRIVFCITSYGGGTGVLEYCSADGSEVYLTLAGTSRPSFQANLLFDKGLMIRTHSGAAGGATVGIAIYASAPGA